MKSMSTLSESSLILLSSAFPYGNAETFLEAELPYLLDRFEHVVVLPLLAEGNPRETDPRLIVIPPHSTQQLRISDLFRGLFRSKGLFSAEWKKSPGYPFSVGLLYRIARTAGMAIRIQKSISETVQNLQLENPLIYSYWTNQASVGAALAGKKLNCIAFSRAHGGDLYEERNLKSYLPFQQWKLQQLDAILPVSENGRLYLENKYPGHKALIQTVRLGTEDQGISDHKPFTSEGKVHVVSCSSVIPLKRNILIFETIKALAELTPETAFRWTHIGDGPLLKELRSKAETSAPENLSVHFAGRVPNNEIIPLYQSCRADLFINYSTSEGAPVSIMEAMSCGLPVVAPDIGGIPELVNEETGLLFKADTAPQALAEIIRGWVSKADMSAVSSKTRMVWQEKFNRRQNMDRMMAIIEKLIREKAANRN